MAGGRPPKLSVVVDRVPVLNADGEPTGELRDVTMIEHLATDLGVGMPVHRAAKRAGITSETFYQWEKAAGRARTRLANGVEHDDLTDYDRLCIEFSDRVNAAELAWEARQNAELERLGRGGIPTLTVREKVDGQGNVIERTETRSTTLPDAQVLLSRLRLRFPKDYSDRLVIAGEGEGGAIPVEVRAAALASAAERFAASKPRSRRAARRRLRRRPAPSSSPAGIQTSSGAAGGESGDR